MQQTIPKVDRDFLARLAVIDFGPIAYKLMNPEEGVGWSLERATQAVEHYRRFLFLVNQYPTNQIVPSREADQVWHTHILDTAKYREDCDVLFGRFMDHWPYLLKEKELKGKGVTLLPSIVLTKEANYECPKGFVPIR